MPTVGIDCRFASELTGLGTYTRSLVTHLLDRENPWSTVLFVGSENEHWVSDLKGKSFKTKLAPFRHYSLEEQIKFPSVIAEAGCSLFFSPHFNVPIGLKIPFICTVHDLILHKYPNQATLFKRITYRYLLQRVVKRSKGIIAVSQATRRDLIETYGNDVGAKTRVIYPGIGPAFTASSEDQKKAIRRKYGLDHPYLLYVGNCKQHKNVPVLIEAFEQANLKDWQLVLVCSGEECRGMKDSPAIRMISDVPFTDLPGIYSASSGFVTATLMEGFGFPALEAMACRTPVLTTSVGSLQEICGQHALMAEPTVHDLAAGMRCLALDPDQRAGAKIDEAQNWAKSFQWEKTAREVAQVIDETLNL
ncbi:MAG: glycosyltransferase family 1 protein [Candidatus Peribacteraceae bacterium]